MRLGDLDPATACDLAYVQLAGRADAMDATFLLAQLIRDVEDVDAHPHRDDLDAKLAAPIGTEARALDDLMTYLRG